MPKVELVSPSRQVLEALKSQRASDRNAAQVLLGVRLPDGWPEHPAAIDLTLLALRHQPDQAAWWMYLFVDPALGSVVGSGGYKGPVDRGCVEIGYEIAPSFRGRGYATAAARLLVQRAFALDPRIELVIAHTLAYVNESGSVLSRVGFHRDPGVRVEGRGARTDEGAPPRAGGGTVWRWRIDRGDLESSPSA